MARKVGQIIARGDRRWLIRVYLGRDRETNKRNYHNQTIHGPMREAQAYLTRKLRERHLGHDLEGAKITLNEYLDRWIQTAVKPRVREKTCQDYEGMLRRYVRPNLGERVLAAMRPLDLQTIYQQMIERGLSARTVRYTHVVLRSAMRQAVQWRLLLENAADGIKLPQQPRREMRALTAEQARVFLKTAVDTPYGPVLALALTTGNASERVFGFEVAGHRFDATDGERRSESSTAEREVVLHRYEASPKPTVAQTAELDCRFPSGVPHNKYRCG
jgi:integrase